MSFLQSRKIIWLFVIVAVVAVGLYLFTVWRDQHLADQEYQPKLTRTVVMQSELPPRFPTGIPLERDAKILQNTYTTSDVGGFQSVRVFITQKSLAENLQLYKKYFENDDWKVESSVDQPNLKSMSVSKGDLLVQVVLNEVPERKTVEITVQQLPPAPPQ